MMRLAEMFYNVPGIEKMVFTSQQSQVYSEERLENLLVANDIDAGFFYDCEKQWTDSIKFIPLDYHIDMSNISMDKYYQLVRQGRWH